MGRRFLDRVFTLGEIEYCFRKSEPYTSLAVRFAAKEAFIKAAGVGRLPFRDIEVVNLESGQPVIRNEGKLKRALEGTGISRVHLSLSHEREYGVAFVVAERGDLA